MKERFMKNVRRSDGCWEWTGAKDDKGYGLFWLKGSAKRAHRLMVEMHTGLKPEGAVILHSCDNPSCVNPEHLSVGTQRDNVLDMHTKCRAASKVGTLNGASKLDEATVLAIKSSCDGHTALGRRYGVSKTTIMRIRSGKSWSHVEVLND